MQFHLPKNRRLLISGSIFLTLIIAVFFGSKFISDLKNRFIPPQAASTGQCKTFTSYGSCDPNGTPKRCTKDSCPSGYRTWVCNKNSKKWQPDPESKCGGGCPWSETNGHCCPKGGDGCSKVGATRCIPDPFIAECVPWPGASSSCTYKNYWKAVDWIASCPAPTTPPKPKTQATATPQPPSPTPSLPPSVVVSPTPTPSRTPTPSPTQPPGVTPSITPVPSATSVPGPTSTPIPPTGAPNSCGGTCGSDINCKSGLFCYQGFCRNPSCPATSSCSCNLAQITPTPGGQALAQSGSSTPTWILTLGGLIILTLGIVAIL